MTVTPDPDALYYLGGQLRTARGMARARAVVVVIGLGLNLCSLVGLGVGLDRGLFLLIFLVSALASGTVFVLDERSDEINPAMVGVRWRSVAASAAEPVPVRVSRVARRVAGWSVRVLPASDRGRYRDELAAELDELRGSSRRAQLAYAVRLLVWSVSLRRALRQARPAMVVRERGW